MPFRLPERVQETTTTEGTGPLTVLGAVPEYYPLSSQLSNGDTTIITTTDGTDTEICNATFNAPSTVVRGSVIYSTNGNALIDWSAGTRNVFVGLPGALLERLLDPSASNGIIVKSGDRDYVYRQIVAGHGVSVIHGNGVAGNITVAQTAIPAGTRMLFHQAFAPAGWTQVTNHNNKALRVVSAGGGGSGGTHSFTTIFGSSRSTQGHALQIAELPSHAHSSGNLTANAVGDHQHPVPTMRGSGFSFGGGGVSLGPTSSVTSPAGGHGHSVSGSTGSVGSGSAHAHALNLDLQYTDVIIASKD